MDQVNEGAAEVVDVDVERRYCKVPVDDLLAGGSRIRFDVYLRVSSSQFLKIANAGEEAAVERARTYKKKGLKYLFFSREDFAKYVGFSLSSARKPKSVAPPDPAFDSILNSAEATLEGFYLEGASLEEFQEAKDFVLVTLGILRESGPAFALLEELRNHSDSVYAHSLGVSLYSTLLARKMNWQTTPTLFKIALAALLHDLGLKDVPKLLLEKNRNTLTPRERAVYETHPIRAMELLNQLRGIPADAILVAYQHHESWNGSGFPQKLSRNRTHPIARLIHVVDTFCECTLGRTGSPKVGAQEAIRQMSQFEAALDPAPFAALKAVFNV